MSEKIVKTLSERETRLLTTLSAAGKQIFTTQDAADILGPAVRTDLVLSRLRRKRWLKRLSKALYLILPFEAGMEGQFTAPAFVLATRLVQPATIAYWSALHHYGLTEQIPQTVFVATTQKKGEVEIADLGLHFKFVTLSSAKMFGLETIWIDGQPVPITDLPKTLVDCLDHPEWCGGIVEATKGIWYGLNEGRVTTEQLTDYADRLGNRAVFKRLGYLVESLGLALDPETPADWQARMSAGYALLDPSMSAMGSRDNRWQLVINVGLPDLTEWRQT